MDPHHHAPYAPAQPNQPQIQPYPDSSSQRVCPTCGDRHPSGWRRSVERPGLTVCNKCGLAERARARRTQSQQGSKTDSSAGEYDGAADNVPSSTSQSSGTKGPRECFTCGATASAAWRTSTQNPGEVVCNRCGLRERKGKEKKMGQSNDDFAASQHVIAYQSAPSFSTTPPSQATQYGFDSSPSPSFVTYSIAPPTSRLCTSCGATASASWRRSIHDPTLMLCNKCGLRERKSAKPSPSGDAKSASSKAASIQLPPPPINQPFSSTPPTYQYQYQQHYHLPPIQGSDHHHSHLSSLGGGRDGEHLPPMMTGAPGQMSLGSDDKGHPRKCFNCGSAATPNWRTSVMYPGQLVCNKCGLSERRQAPQGQGGISNNHPGAHLE